jgi:2-polyprenyl-6-hydroxyphenyl methylase/3-demethylubiquinone-9 3-methyltransferase
MNKLYNDGVKGNRFPPADRTRLRTRPDVTTPATDGELRFAFGRNWRSFVGAVDERALARAETGLKALLGRERLDGLSFLDIGCGSGLSSLAARRLGARVVGFDYDADSVAASEALRARFRPDDGDWRIERGSALDADYLRQLGTFDIVYSWGVLHHTGDMWRAFDLVRHLVVPGGLLALAIYNDQGSESSRWARLKKAYVAGGGFVRALLVAYCIYRQWGRTFVRDVLYYANPAKTWREYGAERGMSAWHDVVDWIGGWPFEVATPEAVFDFFLARGFSLQGLKTCGGGLGCNEFRFRKASP